MLVANAFNAVGAKAVIEQGWTLLCFTGNNFAVGKDLLQIIACGDCASRTGSGSKASHTISRTHNSARGAFERVSRQDIMPEVVAKFFKLVEDDQILTTTAQFPGFIEDLFDV